MKCGYCGKVLKDDAVFCTNCGHRIGEAHDSQSVQHDKNSSVRAIITLLVLIMILTAGGINLIKNGVKGWNVSNSDITAPSPPDMMANEQTSSAEPFVVDEALIGKWLCTDKTAIGYNRSDYGIEVSVTFTFNADGGFSVGCHLENVGITDRDVILNGTYYAENGYLKLNPNLSNYDGSYFDINSTELSVKYSVNHGTLVITDEAGKKTLFTKT